MGATIKFDVRNQSEYSSVHIPQVMLVPLDEINQNLNRFDNNKPFYFPTLRRGVSQYDCAFDFKKPWDSHWNQCSWWDEIHQKN